MFVKEPYDIPLLLFEANQKLFVMEENLYEQERFKKKEREKERESERLFWGF